MTRTTRARSGFNPRPRTGGDRAQAQFVHDPDVSIRAPARGATRTQDAGPPGRSCFNPRPRTGGDHNGDAAHAPGEGFNPRPRTGGDSGAPGPLRQDDHLRVGRFVDAHHAMPIRWRARLRQLRLRCLGGARGHFAPSAPRRPVGGRGVRCVASGRECVRARHHGRCRISVRHENRGSAAPPTTATLTRPSETRSDCEQHMPSDPRANPVELPPRRRDQGLGHHRGRSLIHLHPPT